MIAGRNFDEIMRVLDSLQLTVRHQVSTPANWRLGDDVIISGSVSNEEAQKKYPDGWKAPKPYLRIVPSRRKGPQAEVHMIFRQFCLPCLAHASYIIGDEATGTAAIVDPRRDIDQYIAFASEHSLISVQRLKRRSRLNVRQ